MDSDFLWPEKGDSLFVEGVDSETTAHIMGTSVLSWISMAEAYARVAELAVSNCDRDERHSIALPVVFCYRHAVELHIKYALKLAGSLFRVPIKSTNRTDHALWAIWLELRPLIERLWPNGGNHDVVAVEAMIKEFDNVDPKAQRFRFPYDMKGVRHFQCEERIDLVEYCRSGRKILNFLSGCSDGISETIQAQEP